MSKLVSKTLSGLYNGVSQQAETLRLESQMAEQINFEGTIVKGLFKRPGSLYVDLINAFSSDDVFMSSINRDRTEQYIYAIDTSGIRVWDVAGNEQTVKYGQVNFDDYTYVEDNTIKDYLTTGVTAPGLEFSTMTVGDYTFIVNKTQTTAMTSATASGSIAQTYQTFKDLTDDNNNRSDGDIVKIEGEPDSDLDPYYLERKTSKVYLECPKPGVATTFDKTTMPHGMLRMPGGEFVVTPFDWGEREVGDDDTNPVPSFNGTQIQNVFFWRNRVGYITKSNFLMSKAGSYWTHFCASSMNTLADDPIDVTANTGTVVNLHKTEQFKKTLLLFSDQQQFLVHSGDEILSPDTIKIDPTTDYETDNRSTTCRCGAFAYFVTGKGQWVDVQEFKVQADTLVEHAESTTEHCPKYVPDGNIKLESSPANKMIIVHSAATPANLYCYRYQDVQQKRVQSSWSTWDFGGADILGFEILAGTLYVFVKRDTNTYLESINLENIDTEKMTWTVGLDAQFVATSHSYDAEARTALITMPYSRTDVVAIKTSNGRQSTQATFNGTTITLNNVTTDGEEFICGLPISGEVTLSPWFLKNRRDSPILEGRLQIRNVILQFKNTGNFKVEITNRGRDPRTVVWNNNKIGNITIGQNIMQSGSFKTGVRGRNTETKIKIISDSAMPVQITAIGYEGAFTQRASIL